MACNQSKPASSTSSLPTDLLAHSPRPPLLLRRPRQHLLQPCLMALRLGAAGCDNSAPAEPDVLALIPTVARDPTQDGKTSARARHHGRGVGSRVSFAHAHQWRLPRRHLGLSSVLGAPMVMRHGAVFKRLDSPRLETEARVAPRSMGRSQGPIDGQTIQAVSEPSMDTV